MPIMIKVHLEVIIIKLLSRVLMLIKTRVMILIIMLDYNNKKSKIFKKTIRFLRKFRKI